MKHGRAAAAYGRWSLADASRPRPNCASTPGRAGAGAGAAQLRRCSAGSRACLHGSWSARSDSGSEPSLGSQVHGSWRHCDDSGSNGQPVTAGPDCRKYDSDLSKTQK